jgi:multidrug efflux pump subunit AcrA (membrane-fusion protein)
MPLSIIYLSIALIFYSPSFAGTTTHNMSDSNTLEIQIIEGSFIDKRAVLGGVVVSSSMVNLSAQVSGDVLSVLGREGSVFKKGETLITLEQTSIQAQKDAINAEISSAREALRNTQVQYEKSIVSPYANDMFGGAFTMFTEPMGRFTNANDPSFNKYANRTSHYSNLQQAKNKLKQVVSKAKQIDERLKDALVIAPFDGVIVVKNVNKGDVVQAGQNLIQFANIQNLQVALDVPSRLLRSLQLNKKYRIKLDLINTVVESTLTQIYPIADSVKHSVKVKFDLPKNTPVLSGSYAEVEIFYGNAKNQTPVVNEKAVVWRSSLPSVFVVNRNNQTELRFIRLGDQVGEGKKSVLSGLKIGERIIANPTIMTKAGIRI